MLIIGCDYHPSVQQIAWADAETGECGEKRLMHSNGEAERFYRELKQRGVQVRVGMEATGHARWFERLLAELGFELWVGDPAEIRATRVRKKKNDREDARLMRKLLLENRFPRIWVPSPENRDRRQLLWHRHRLVQMRTRIMNQLQAVAMNEGYRWKKKLFSEKGRGLLEKLPLAPWASRRRKELLELLDQLDPKIAELTAAVEQEAKKRPEVVQLMTHPGVGPITGLAYVLVIGTPGRFPCGKQIGSYTGLIPCEDSSAGKQRLGHISKQGNTLLRFLLVEASQAAARCNPDWRRRYAHLMMRREKRIAKVAMARKLAVRLYWMWRNNWQYSRWLNTVRRGKARLRASRGRRCRDQRRLTRPLAGVNGEVCIEKRKKLWKERKKDLTAPALLEMDVNLSGLSLSLLGVARDQRDIELQQMSHEPIEREGRCDAVCRSRRRHREIGARLVAAAGVSDGLTEAAARDKT